MEMNQIKSKAINREGGTHGAHLEDYLIALNQTEMDRTKSKPSEHSLRFKSSKPNPPNEPSDNQTNSNHLKSIQIKINRKVRGCTWALQSPARLSAFSCAP